MGGDKVRIWGFSDFFKWGMQALVTKKVPLTLISCIRSNRLASVCSDGVREIAEALLTTISIPPNTEIPFSTACSICSSDLISHCTASAFPPAASISSAAEKMVPPSLAFSTVDFAATIILAPSLASLNAIAFPIPRLAPVMKTVLFFKRHD